MVCEKHKKVIVEWASAPRPLFLAVLLKEAREVSLWSLPPPNAMFSRNSHINRCQFSLCFCSVWIRLYAKFILSNVELFICNCSMPLACRACISSCDLGLYQLNSNCIVATTKITQPQICRKICVCIESCAVLWWILVLTNTERKLTSKFKRFHTENKSDYLAPVYETKRLFASQNNTILRSILLKVKFCLIFSFVF